jgi:hypothetical protein
VRASSVPLRRELLNRVLILGEGHLRAILTEYQAHYITARPHQGIAQRAPHGRHDRGHLIVADLDCGRILRTHPGRPDQRMCERRLISRRTAGHGAGPIFERHRRGQHGHMATQIWKFGAPVSALSNTLR